MKRSIYKNVWSYIKFISREIYNPCAGIYNFDMNFEEEVCTDNIEEVLEKWIGKRLPEFHKKVYDDGLTI